jgi:hypothetical protein
MWIVAIAIFVELKHNRQEIAFCVSASGIKENLLSFQTN